MTSTTRQSHKNNQKQPQSVDLSVCALCLGSEDDVENYGKFFRCTVQELAVHEYCLFFASGLAQNGKDDEGFDGFLYQDIRDEVKRASKLRCTVCHKKGAPIGCCVYKCGSAFHFNCGLQKHALFQFFDSFRTYCKRHRPTQNTVISSESTQCPTCPICLCDVDFTDALSILKSPCCKNAWFHRSCIQKQALAYGMYYFRCAFCNNIDEFQEEMKQMGIYIPVRDAIWEQGDAYVELLHQYNRCDAPNCVCPKGRDFSGTHKGQKWKIYKCFACGQSGTHRWCQKPAITRKYFCQNCVVCFPQHEQARSNTSVSSASENGSFNESQSTMLLNASQDSEITQDMNASTDDIPLALLKAKITAGSKEGATSENKPSDTTHCTSSLPYYSEPDQELDVSLRDGLNKDDHDSNADSETTTLSMESGLACVNKDGICNFDDYTTIVSTDDSNSVDIETLSTVSSCALSLANDTSSLNIDNPKVKLKGKKRKAPTCTKQSNAVTQIIQSKPPRTKANRKGKREELKQKKKMQKGERPKLKKKTKKNEAGMSTKSDTKNNDLCKDENDSFCLNLSLESDAQGNDLKMKSPNQIGNIPEDSIDEDCSDKCTFDESFAVANNYNEMDTVTSRENDITKGITGSSSEAELSGIETTSTSTMQLSPNKSNGSEMSIASGKKKLLQRDIRSMLISPKSDPDSPLESPTGFGGIGCQSQPLKLHRAKKRRKLSPSIPECKSITTFMSVNASSPKRKLPKKKLHCDTLNSLPSNDDTETVSSPVSNLFIDTMTAAKGMVMHAFNRLCGSSEESDSSTCTPKISPIESDESLKSGPSEVREHVHSTLAPCSSGESMCLEDSDSDSSDSIKVVKVKKGRSRRNISGVPVKTGGIPSYIHERYCACYKRRQWMLSRLNKPTDPKEVIVIDDEHDEHDEQDSGKGSSRDTCTSDAGTKSGDGNGSAEDKEFYPCNEDGNQMDSFCYSSCDDFSFDDHNDAVWSNTSQSRKADAASSLQTVDSKKQKRISKRNSRKSSKQHRTDVKKQKKYSENLWQPSNSDTNVEPPTVLSNSSSLTEKHFKENGDRVDDSFESLDCLVDIECTENNYFKGELRMKTSQENVTLSPLSKKAKSNLPSKKAKSKELGNKSFLSLKKYMECSDEDFQAKKRLTSKTKGVKSAKSSYKDKYQTKKRKGKISGTREHFGNSSCTSTVSATVTDNTL